MNATHSDKTLKRVLNILDYLKQNQSNKEVFVLNHEDYVSLDPSLENDDLLAMVVKEINEHGKGKVKAEIRLKQVADGSILNPGARFISYLWLFVANSTDLDILKDAISNEIEVGKNQVLQFTLDDKKVLRLIGVEDKKVVFRSDGERYDLLKYLAERKDFVSKGELYDTLGLSPIAIRKIVTKIRDAIVEEFNVARSSLFENLQDDAGYRVMNVTLLKNE